MGSGAGAPANCHASPPSASFTSWGALSWYFFGRWFFQMSGGSRMWQSASTMRYFDMEILPRWEREPGGAPRSTILEFPDARVNSDAASEPHRSGARDGR